MWLYHIVVRKLWSALTAVSLFRFTELYGVSFIHSIPVKLRSGLWLDHCSSLIHSFSDIVDLLLHLGPLSCCTTQFSPSINRWTHLTHTLENFGILRFAKLHLRKPQELLNQCPLDRRERSGDVWPKCTDLHLEKIKCSITNTSYQLAPWRGDGDLGWGPWSDWPKPPQAVLPCFLFVLFF